MGMANSSFRNIGSFLQENIYYIPDYQREYSWDINTEVDDFWNDLNENIAENREQHFFGQIVIHNCVEEKKKYIIDGQQRTITSTILLCVLNKIFQEIFENYNIEKSRNKSEDIRLKYIGRWSEDENELKLHLGIIDNKFFFKNIQKGEITNIIEKSIKQSSHKKIYNTYNYFLTKIKEEIENLSPEEKYKKIFKIYDYFITSFRIIYFETDDINEAFIIFETLNARGKDLETADLLKNHLFRIAGKSVEKIKEEWQSMINNLDGIDATKYIRHFRNSTSSFTREKDLYKVIRQDIKTVKNCEDLLKDLLKLSQLYRFLNKPQEENYFNNKQVNLLLLNLNSLAARSFYPIILAMVNSEYLESEIEKVLVILETLIVRNVVIAGKVANKYEIIFAKVAYNIYHKQLNNSNEIIEELRTYIMSDNEFKISFQNYTCKSKPVARYILRKLNTFADNENKELTIIDDNNKIHIEHIMPESIGKWRISKDIHSEYLNRLGNLTLMGNEYNKEIQNYLFDEKKKVYKKSKIKITNDLLKYQEWNEIQIQERQNEFAEQACLIWKV